MAGVRSIPLVDGARRHFDVLCAGEALWSFAAATRSGPFRPGGGALSAARSLARRGLSVGLVTSLADDSFGRSLRSQIEAHGVDVGGVRLLPPRSGIVRLEGTDVVSFREDEEALEVPESWSSRVLLLSGLSPVVANAASLCKAARAARRDGATVVLDVHAPWHRWAGRNGRAVAMVVREADVVHATVQDLAALGMPVAVFDAMLRRRAVLVGTDAVRGPFGELRRAAAATHRSTAVRICAELARARHDGANDGALWQRVVSPSSPSSRKGLGLREA
jgi:sugar/nucleoside kinase (ribokinase family)